MKTFKNLLSKAIAVLLFVALGMSSCTTDEVDVNPNLTGFQLVEDFQMPAFSHEKSFEAMDVSGKNKVVITIKSDDPTILDMYDSSNFEVQPVYAEDVDTGISQRNLENETPEAERNTQLVTDIHELPAIDYSFEVETLEEGAVGINVLQKDPEEIDDKNWQYATSFFTPFDGGVFEMEEGCMAFEAWFMFLDRWYYGGFHVVCADDIQSNQVNFFMQNSFGVFIRAYQWDGIAGQYTYYLYD